MIMFLLDLYKWCESYDWFNRQHIAKFIYQHRECERLARAAGLTPRMFASLASKEFCARMMTAGYIDGVCGKYWSKGSSKRPFGFELYSLDGMRNDWIRDMARIGEMGDDELFQAKANRQDLEALRRKFNLT
ncbi:putative YdbL protein [Escherichia phage JLBYU07]|uniref:Hypotheticl protein n=1 Tax=Escherichia phage vB_Eco_SLUR29 TaxID=2585737 RepID=A0A509ENM5_9CAUD|nr:hypotheticl protein [Escherichia phage vB_Eco_SLUR29]UGL62287.1 putative YdbL protein [Escherichia phage JLBYU07]UGL62377.1 putative YdbL protein [Escherichia phage JLBYU10]UGO56887.1 putative YdbL protein [Escherichia phage JLBYU19]VUE36004.1 hypotheticl protein [Escherichia phage vB_Eco_SLUR29]